MSRYAIADTESGTVINIQNVNVYIIPWPATPSEQEEIVDYQAALQTWAEEQGSPITPEKAAIIAGQNKRELLIEDDMLSELELLSGAVLDNDEFNKHNDANDDDIFDAMKRTDSLGWEHSQQLNNAALLNDWKYEVQNGDTRLGFDNWIQHQTEAALYPQAAYLSMSRSCFSFSNYLTANYQPAAVPNTGRSRLISLTAAAGLPSRHRNTLAAISIPKQSSKMVAKHALKRPLAEHINIATQKWSPKER